MLRHLAGLGLGADVASGGELRHAVGRAGFAATRVVFTGPGKRDEELRAAVDAGVRVVTVESPGELRRLASIAEALGRRQPILLRAAVSGDRALERVRLVGDGGAGKFGMDGSDLRMAAAEAVASPWLEPVGLHAFGASNVTEASSLAAHVEATIDAAVEVAAGAGFALRLVDAGGGLGIPYAAGEDGPGRGGARHRARAGGRAARHGARRRRRPRAARAGPLPRRDGGGLRRPRRRSQDRGRQPRRDPRRGHPPRPASRPRRPGAPRQRAHGGGCVGVTVVTGVTAVPGHGRGPTVLGARRVRAGGRHGAPGPGRPRRRAGRRRVRGDGVDAVLPVASAPARDRAAGGRGMGCPAAGRP